MLRLDIAWLSGTARLARDPSDPEPDWPPQPDRVFSALVASWGLGGEDGDERAALEWLEDQPPPKIAVPFEAFPRDTARVYVPPNDSRGVEVLPDRRKRQERGFPAVTLDPEDPVHLALLWNETPTGRHREALDALAHRTSYIGHSASLVRARFSEVETGPEDLRPAHGAPYKGRLAELEALHHRHMRGEPAARPRPSTRAGEAVSAPPDTRPFVGDPDAWVVFEHAGGERPDLRAAVILCDHMRLVLMEAWTRANHEPAPAWIAGHEPDGSPARAPHLAVVPLANVGWTHSDGNLMGLALIPPRQEVEAWARPGPDAFARRHRFRKMLAELGETGQDRTVLTLAPRGSTGTWRWRLAPRESEARSLDPKRYLRPSRVWDSVTPVLLDRHPKARGDERRGEIEDMLRRACVRIGLPEPVHVHSTGHATAKGVPSARPPGGSPGWTGWSRKKSFGARPFIHVRLVFGDAVAGPILLGAGRFVGLGLLLPRRETRQ